MKAFDLTKLAALIQALALAVLLSACTDGGGDRASGVEPGPDEPGGPVEPPPPILPPDPPTGDIDAGELGPDDSLTASIDGLSFNSPPTVTFSVTANGNQAVSGITSSNIRLSLAKLIPNPGDSAGESWSSYILSKEDPICREQADIDTSYNACTTFTASTDPGAIPDTAKKVQDAAAIGTEEENQATTENSGTLVDNGNGSWSYTYNTDMGDPAGLDEVHRSCIQFSFASAVDNACIDFIPSGVADPAIGDRDTSLDDTFYDNYSSRQIATEETCNTCHDKLALHGGGRTQIDYCVTCHNPDTTDANTANSVDMKVLVHKLHNGRNLPSVADDGGSYKIFGYRNGEHDYSNLSYPQEVINCSRCHAGQEDIDFANAQGLPLPEAEITRDGHNWVSNPTLTACISCHENLVTDNLKLDGTTPSTDHTSYTDETNCAGCHRDRGPDEPGRLQADQAHRDLTMEASRGLALAIEAVSNTGPGENPVVEITLSRDGTPINIFSFGGKLQLGVAWDAATDLDNEGISGFDALNIEFTIGLGNSINLGNNRFEVTSPDPVLADQDTVAIMLFGHEDEGRCGSVLGQTPEDCRPIESQIAFAPSTASTATERRKVVDIAKCDNCHNRLAMTDSGHAGFHATPAEKPRLCASCHGPGLGFDEIADFRVLVHGVHASNFRETPYKHYDGDTLQYPGDLSDCQSCHLEGTYTLPTPVQSPPLKGGSTYTSVQAATCSSCHDSAVAKAHMESAGGASFDTDFDTANMAESCDICHASGKDADVDKVHNK